MAKWIVFACAAIAFAIVGTGAAIEKKRRKAGKENIVHAPEIGFWGNTAIGAVFLFFAWNTDSLAAAICFCCASLLGSFLLLNWKNNAFIFDEEGFTERNFLGKTKRYRYDQISGRSVDERMAGLVFLYVNEKQIGLNLMWENADALYDAMKAGYRKTHDDQGIPVKSELKEAEKGFRAHVYRADEYRTYFIVIVTVVVVVGVMFALGALRPINMEYADPIQLSLYSWETQGEDIVLHDWQLETDFVICGYAECVNEFELMAQSMDAHEALHVRVKLREPAGEAPYYRIYEISSGETVFMTAKDANRYDQKYLPLIIGGFMLVLAAVFGVFGFIYAVGSNPRKYPGWLVRCLFKKDRIRM